MSNAEKLAETLTVEQIETAMRKYLGYIENGLDSAQIEEDREQLRRLAEAHTIAADWMRQDGLTWSTAASPLARAGRDHEAELK